MSNLSLNNNNYEVNDLTLNGIGGWLILVAIGVVFSPVLILLTLIQNHLAIILNGTFIKLIDTNLSIFGLVLFEIVGNLIFLIFSITIIIKFFKKSSAFPKFQIVFYISNLLFLLTDNIIASIFINNISISSDILRSSMTAIIWSSYLLKSRRVKNTFIN